MCIFARVAPEYQESETCHGSGNWCVYLCRCGTRVPGVGDVPRLWELLAARAGLWCRSAPGHPGGDLRLPAQAHPPGLRHFRHRHLSPGMLQVRTREEISGVEACLCSLGDKRWHQDNLQLLSGPVDGSGSSCGSAWCGWVKPWLVCLVFVLCLRFDLCWSCF